MGKRRLPHFPLRVTPRLDRGVQSSTARPERSALDSAIKSRNDKWGDERSSVSLRLDRRVYSRGGLPQRKWRWRGRSRASCAQQPKRVGPGSSPGRRGCGREQSHLSPLGERSVRQHRVRGMGRECARPTLPPNLRLPSGLTGGPMRGRGSDGPSGQAGGYASKGLRRRVAPHQQVGKQKRQMACKPGSVPAAPEGGRRWPFICDACCQTPGATNPDSSPETGHVPSLFGLAPGGVYRAASVARRAVRSYRTLSPLPAEAGGLLSVALSLGSPPPDVIRHRVSVEPGLSSVSPQRPSGHLADAHKPERRCVGQGRTPTISPCGGPRLCPCSGHSQYQ